MIDPQSQTKMRQEINSRIENDYELLKNLREEIRPLKSGVRRIQPRTTTSISLVGTDGGNNRIQFDPFLLQLVRVVDSSNKIKSRTFCNFLQDGTSSSSSSSHESNRLLLSFYS